MGSAMADPCYVYMYGRNTFGINTFGRAAVAPYPFVNILTWTPKVSGSTAKDGKMGAKAEKTRKLEQPQKSQAQQTQTSNESKQSYFKARNITRMRTDKQGLRGRTWRKLRLGSNKQGEYH